MSRDPSMTGDLLARSVELHPDWCASEHAREMGISRERVRQLRVQLGLMMPDKRGMWGLPKRPCPTCGESLRWRTTYHRGCRPSMYGVPARSREYQRRWQRDYYRRCAS